MAAASQSGKSLDHTRGDGDLSNDDPEHEKAETLNVGADTDSQKTEQDVYNAPSMSGKAGSGFVSRLFRHANDVREIISFAALSLGSIKRLNEKETENYS